MSSGPVLVVAAHPDDEVLGCGGTIAALATSGRDLHVVFMTDGVSSRGAGDVGARVGAANQAAEILGANPPEFRDFPDNAMDDVRLLDVVQCIEAVVEDVQPETVFTHHRGELNIDHEVVHRAVITACRPLPGHSVREILTFSVRSSTEWAMRGADQIFRPQCFVDISESLPQKMKALEAYAAEMREVPHSRSYAAVEAEALVTGATFGVPAAEAFEVVRLAYR